MLESERFRLTRVKVRKVLRLEKGRSRGDWLRFWSPGVLLRHRDEVPSPPATPETQDRERNCRLHAAQSISGGGCCITPHHRYHRNTLFLPGAPQGESRLSSNSVLGTGQTTPLCPQFPPLFFLDTRTLTALGLNSPQPWGLPSAPGSHPGGAGQQGCGRIAKLGKGTPGTSPGMSLRVTHRLPPVGGRS